MAEFEILNNPGRRALLLRWVPPILQAVVGIGLLVVVFGVINPLWDPDTVIFKNADVIGIPRWLIYGDVFLFGVCTVLSFVLPLLAAGRRIPWRLSEPGFLIGSFCFAKAVVPLSFKDVSSRASDYRTVAIAFTLMGFVMVGLHLFHLELLKLVPSPRSEDGA